jgi:type IV pilus assembly protein PilV
MLMMSAPNKGFSLIEVLVTILILMIGLLGLAGLQVRALTSQMESYQRSQALILLKDMVDRIEENRINALDYVTTTPLGTDFGTCAASGVGSAGDLCEWHNALLGAAEVDSSGNKVGAMIGARGCIYQTAAAASGVPGEFLVAVAWQGLNNTAAPAVDCGINEYGNEALRRVVTLPISIANLN